MDIFECVKSFFEIPGTVSILWIEYNDRFYYIASIYDLNRSHNYTRWSYQRNPNDSLPLDLTEELFYDGTQFIKQTKTMSVNLSITYKDADTYNHISSKRNDLITFDQKYTVLTAYNCPGCYCMHVLVDICGNAYIEIKEMQ